MQTIQKKLNSTLYLLIFCALITTVLFISYFVPKLNLVAFLLIAIYIIFLNFTNQIGILCFFHGFARLFITNISSIELNLFDALLGITFFVVGIKYLTSVFTHKAKFDYKPFIPLILLVVFILIPINSSFSLVNYLKYFVLFIAMFFVYVYRNQINLNKILNMLVIGLITSCLVAFILEFNTYKDALYIFGGLFTNRNHLATSCSISIGFLLALNFNTKMSLKNIVMFATLFFLGLLTSSRAFLACFAITFLAYAVMNIVKYKKTGLKSVLSLIISSLLVGIVFFKTTSYAIGRIQYDSEAEDIMNAIDNGRVNLLKMYLKDFVSSISTILFGKGYNAPLLGELSSHNSYVQSLWLFGIVGTLLIATYVLYMLITLKPFSSKKNWPSIIILLPFIFVSLVEVAFFGFNALIVLMFLFVYFDKNNQKDPNAKTKLISIIVPVYNSEKHLNKCLNSIKNQTYKNLEIILVNDGSKDGSLKICEKFANEDKRFKIISTKNNGVSSARNTGLKNATGEIIQFIDADDTISENCCSIVANNFDDNCDLIIFSFKKSNGTFSLLKNNSYSTTTEISNLFCQIVHDWQFGLLWNKAYKKDLISNILFDEKISIQEDLDFNLQYVKDVKNIKTLNDVLYTYNLTQNSLSRSNKAIEKDQLFNIYNKFEDYNKTVLKNDKFKKHYNAYFIKSLINLFKGDTYTNEDISKILEDKKIIKALKNYKSAGLKEKLFILLIKYKKLPLIRKFM